MFPGKIQWVWEKPCLYTPPEGIDCVFMEHAYLTQQVPDRLWRFFFFLARKHTSFQGTLFQAEATTGQCKYTSLSAGNENEWLPVVLFIPHLYIKLRSATVFAEALRRQYQVQPSGCQLRWNAHCVDSVLLILELEWKLLYLCKCDWFQDSTAVTLHGSGWVLRKCMNVFYIFLDFQSLWDFDLFYFPAWDLFSPSIPRMILN